MQVQAARQRGRTGVVNSLRRGGDRLSNQTAAVNASRTRRRPSDANEA
jgi:hypothetical protein